MTAELLGPDQRDALQEVANIGMGLAGASIAQILNEFVHLSIPRILTVRPDQIGQTIQAVVGRTSEVSAVRQAFHGHLRGEALVIYGQASCRELAELMGYDAAPDPATEHELLLDVTNVLVGACLGSMAEQLKTDVGFSAPSMAADRVSPAIVVRGEEMRAACALFMEVNFHLERRSFACHLIMLMPEEEIAAIGDAVDRFMENY
ncbi:MAG: hypothetical protein AB1768_21160 [Pseudomonadota bacterium]|jgi:chemotaxis protein CheC